MRNPLKRRSRTFEDTSGQSLEYPYYVDIDALRGLASNLGIELPVSRQITTEGTLSVSPKGVGASSKRGEVSQLVGQVHLNRLAVLIAQRLAYELADDLTYAYSVGDRARVEEAISRVEQTLGTQSATRELLGQVKRAFDEEYAAQVAQEHRNRLAAAAHENRLVSLRAQFRMCPSGADTQLKREALSDRAMAVEVTHLEPYRSGLYGADYVGAREADLPMPEALRIQVVLAENSLFTPGGRERILERGEAFYGRALAHSASFAESTGTFICSAYALWGVPRAVSLSSHGGEVPWE